MGRERQMFGDLPRLYGYVEEPEVMGRSDPFYGELVAYYVGPCSRCHVEGPPAEGVCKDEVLAGLVGYFNGSGAEYEVFADTGVQYGLGGLVVGDNPYDVVVGVRVCNATTMFMASRLFMWSVHVR